MGIRRAGAGRWTFAVFRLILPVMPKMRKKSDLPTKLCVACGRPFAWRKKWERAWSEVKFCSDACRMTKGRVVRG